MHGTVNLTRAAELLTDAGDPVTRSTLSRYVKNHADALNPTIESGQTFVDYEALAAHRRENIRLDLSDKSSISLERSEESNRADEVARNVRAQRLSRELDLAERVKLLIPRREVEEAAIAAVTSMRNALALAQTEIAEQIGAAVGCEPRLIRPHLRAFERVALETFVKDLANRQLAHKEVLREGAGLGT